MSYIAPDSHPVGTRSNKFIDTRRDSIFIGYNENTTKHYRIYAPDRHTTLISTNVRFFPDVKGGTIDNY
jgi:hypothetical protein